MLCTPLPSVGALRCWFLLMPPTPSTYSYFIYDGTCNDHARLTRVILRKSYDVKAWLPHAMFLVFFCPACSSSQHIYRYVVNGLNRIAQSRSRACACTFGCRSRLHVHFELAIDLSAQPARDLA